MDISNLLVTLFGVAVIIGIVASIIAVIFVVYRKQARQQKDYERSLKMVQLRIQLPPSSDDKDVGNRDMRDVTDETVSQAQTMYNIIASTATKGFHSRLYGQRHITFEIVANDGLIHYYTAVPYVLLDNVKQAIMAAYPNARLEEVEEINLFSRAGKLSGTLGGELSLTKSYVFPLATYKDTKRDAMGAILNALTMAERGDGAGVQILLRPAKDGWSKRIDDQVRNIRDGKKGAGGRGGMDLSYFGQILEALWRPPTSSDKDKEIKQLSGTDQSRVEAMEEKAKHSGYEVMIRLIVSTPNSARSHTLLTSLQSAFSLFNSPTGNSFKFTAATNIQEFITSYVMRFFPADRSSDILNTVELASIFHLPNQTNIPSSQVERQMIKEVDGPTQQMDPTGLLLGYNLFRGVRKEIRLSQNDRRRHVYVMGSTGMGKSVFLKNLALQDMQAGRGFAFVDPHGDAAEDLLKMVPKNRVDDVIYFNPDDRENPIGMNLFEVDPHDPDPEHTKDYIISETNNMLMSLYDPNNQGIVGPRMTNIVRNAALLVMADPNGGTFMDIPKVLNDPDFAKPKIKYLTNARAIDFWTKEWPNLQRSNEAGDLTNWVVSKWADFETGIISNILGQTHSSLSMRDIMDNHKILLVNLSKGKLGDLPAKLLGMIFVMKFQAAAMSRANIPEDQRQDFCLYVDEFQNFATESFSTILSEARKYRLNLIVVNQFMGQLTEAIRGAILANVGTFVIGRCGTEDVEEAVKLFQPVFQPEDLLFMPNYMAAAKLLIDGYPSQPFTMKLPSPMGTPNDEVGQMLAQMSAQRYGRPRAQVEAATRKRWATVKPTIARKPANPVVTTPASGGNSFLDNWLAKRQGMINNSIPTASAPTAPILSTQPNGNGLANSTSGNQNGQPAKAYSAQPVMTSRPIVPQPVASNQPVLPGGQHKLVKQQTKTPVASQPASKVEENDGAFTMSFH